MSLIGLLAATEKQVHLGLLHMTPTQWYLKNNWRVPESLEVMITVPRSLHPHLKWWLEESNVHKDQPLHPLQRSLKQSHCKGNSELKAVFLALKEFQTL